VKVLLQQLPEFTFGFHPNARFPSFRCRSSVAFRHSRYLLPIPYTAAVAAVIAYLFAIYGCNGTEFSYVTFAQQRNFTVTERRKGNGRTEWWKPGITQNNSGLGQ